jgi:probable RNA-binding protein EIF1AD
MAPPRRKLLETVESTQNPPSSLAPSQTIARIVAAKGSNLYEVETPVGTTLLVELQPKFRSTIWLKRGGFCVIDSESLAERDNKIEAEIVNVVANEKNWRKAAFWPKEFPKRNATADVISSDDEDEE